MARIKQTKLKKFLTTVTVTKTIQKTVYALTKPGAIKKLKDEVKAKPPRFVNLDFSASDASEIVTIYEDQKPADNATNNG